MANFNDLPPEMMDVAEAAGTAAQEAMANGGNFDDIMEAAGDVMEAAGMSPEMMANISDAASNLYNDHMANNPDSNMQDAFDAVDSGMETHLDQMGEGPIADMGPGDMPPPPPFEGDPAPPAGGRARALLHFAVHRAAAGRRAASGDAAAAGRLPALQRRA